MCNPLAAFKRSNHTEKTQQEQVVVIHPSTKSFQTMSSGALAGKVALITGASKGMSLVLHSPVRLDSEEAVFTHYSLGIGKATAVRLARDGASVVINYASDSASANELVKQIGNDRAFAVQADAGSVSGIETMVNATVKHFGKIDILIPNAGILPMKDLKNTSEDDFDQIVKLNIKGPYFLVQVRLSTPCAPSMLTFWCRKLSHTWLPDRMSFWCPPPSPKPPPSCLATSFITPPKVLSSKWSASCPKISCVKVFA